MSSVAGVFDGLESIQEVERELAEQLDQPGCNGRGLLSSATYQVHAVLSASHECKGCAVRLLTYVNTPPDRRLNAADWPCESAREAAKFADRWFDRLPQEVEESSVTAPASPVEESALAAQLRRATSWPASEAKALRLLEKEYPGAVEEALRVIREFGSPNVSTLPHFASSLTREIGSCWQKSRDGWPACSELGEGINATYAAGLALRQVIGCDKANVPSQLVPMRTLFDELAIALDWRQATCADESYSGLVVRRICEIAASKLTGRFERRTYDARDELVISDRINELLSDTELSERLFYPGMLSPWAIKVGRLELLRRGQYEMTSLFEEREADLIDCVIALYCEAITLSSYATQASTLAESEATSGLVAWCAKCQGELEKRTSKDISRLLRNLGLLKFLAELNHDTPAPVVTLIHNGLNGGRATTTVVEEACHALVRRGQGDIFAAIYRYILGFHQEPTARIKAVNLVQNLTRAIAMARSEGEARAHLLHLGHQPRQDAFNDEVLDLTVEFVTDRNAS